MALLNLCFWACAEPIRASQNECIVNTAAKYLHVRETTNNRGPEVDIIIKKAGGRPGQPWCGWFATFVHMLCGVEKTKTGGGLAMSWFDRKHLISPSMVVPGDVASVFNKYMGRIGHILIIREWNINSQFFLSLEGNTNAKGSREGSGVRSLQRSKKDCYNFARWWK
jgi:hypothetical protein